MLLGFPVTIETLGVADKQLEEFYSRMEEYYGNNILYIIYFKHLNVAAMLCSPVDTSFSWQYIKRK